MKGSKEYSIDNINDYIVQVLSGLLHPHPTTSCGAMNIINSLPQPYMFGQAHIHIPHKPMSTIAELNELHSQVLL